MKDDSFTKYLEQVRRTVESRPEWKRGGTKLIKDKGMTKKIRLPHSRQIVGAWQAKKGEDLEIQLTRYEGKKRYVAMPVKLKWKLMDDGEFSKATIVIPGTGGQGFLYAIHEALGKLKDFHEGKDVPG